MLRTRKRVHAPLDDYSATLDHFATFPTGVAKWCDKRNSFFLQHFRLTFRLFCHFATATYWHRSAQIGTLSDLLEILALHEQGLAYCRFPREEPDVRIDYTLVATFRVNEVPLSDFALQHKVLVN
jgi:hypothetical protein